MFSISISLERIFKMKNVKGMNVKKTRLSIELLESRCVPSAALPTDLLDGSVLFADPMFDNALFANANYPKSPTPQQNSSLAGNSVTPMVGGLIQGSNTSAIPQSVAGPQNNAPVPQTPGCVITVNTLSDANINTAMTLREAVDLSQNGSTAGLTAAQLAQISGNPHGGNDTIVFSVGGTIKLNSELNGGEALKFDVTINGGGNIIIDGNGNQILHNGNHGNGTTLNLLNLTLENGNATDGGAILNNGILNLDHDTFQNNTASDAGGAVANISLPHGGSDNPDPAFTNAFDSTFNDNHAPKGSALYSAGATDDDDSEAPLTKDDKEDNDFNLAVVNSTVANNNNSAIYSSDAAILTNDTVAFNVGGVTNAGDEMTINNTIVAANTTSDITGNVDGSYNVVGTKGDGGLTVANHNQLNVANPGINALGFYGGFIKTCSEQPTSVAVDHGNNALAVYPDGSPIVHDERGFARIVGTSVDVGAFELQPHGLATQLELTGLPTYVIGQDYDATATILDDFSNVVKNFTGTITLTSDDPSAVLPAPYKFTLADAASHEFKTITFNTHGPHVLNATDKADNLFGTLTVTEIIPPPVVNPTTGVFFKDGINQLWLYMNGTFTNTGAFAEVLSATDDGNGNPECWFTDGNNQIWNYDNGVFTETIGFATRLAAHGDTLVFTDGNNEIYLFQKGGNFLATGGFAEKLTMSDTGKVAFTDGTNAIWTLQNGKFTQTGGFAEQLSYGSNDELWFTDGNNRIWSLTGTQFTESAGFATRLAGSLGKVWFTDGNNEIWEFDNTTFTETPGFATRVTADHNNDTLAFTDGNNEIYILKNGQFIQTPGFAEALSEF
jgi:hypothetical protein